MKYIIAIIASMMVAGCSCNVGAGQPEPVSKVAPADERSGVVIPETDELTLPPFVTPFPAHY